MKEIRDDAMNLLTWCNLEPSVTSTDRNIQDVVEDLALVQPTVLLIRRYQIWKVQIACRNQYTLQALLLFIINILPICLAVRPSIYPSNPSNQPSIHASIHPQGFQAMEIKMREKSF